MEVLVLPNSYKGEKVYEPQYPSPALRHKPHADISMIYFGDDYGGHNIPFPHPEPPKPHRMYDDDAFVDLTNYIIGTRQASKVDDKLESRKKYSYEVQALMPKPEENKQEPERERIDKGRSLFPDFTKRNEPEPEPETEDDESEEDESEDEPEPAAPAKPAPRKEPKKKTPPPPPKRPVSRREEPAAKRPRRRTKQAAPAPQRPAVRPRKSAQLPPVP